MDRAMDRLAMEAHLILQGWIPLVINWEHLVRNSESNRYIDIDMTMAVLDGYATIRSGMHPFEMYEPCEWEHLTDFMIALAFRATGAGEFDG